jgi:hypothetical protein
MKLINFERLSQLEVTHAESISELFYDLMKIPYYHQDIHKVPNITNVETARLYIEKTLMEEKEQKLHHLILVGSDIPNGRPKIEGVAILRKHDDSEIKHGVVELFVSPYSIYSLAEQGNAHTKDRLRKITRELLRIARNEKFQMLTYSAPHFSDGYKHIDMITMKEFGFKEKERVAMNEAHKFPNGMTCTVDKSILTLKL